MPQEIPVEASETLVFTPPALADMDPQPKFVLRAMTGRDKRFHLRLYREEGVTLHQGPSFRAETITGLKDLWEPKDFDDYVPRIKAYWEALDDFELQLKDDPDLAWTFDADEEAKVKLILSRIDEAWPPLRRMYADNAEFGQMVVPLMVAAVVKSWAGLDVPMHRDRGYLSVECAEALCEAVSALNPVALSELFVACADRVTLSKEEEKNSASPLPSKTPLSPSSETPASEQVGKSKESTAAAKGDASTPTPEAA